jgi:hypothetical protein
MRELRILADSSGQENRHLRQIPPDDGRFDKINPGDDAILPSLRSEGGMTRLSHAEMYHGIQLMVVSKLNWLSRFSDGRSKRPDHEIDQKRRELAVLRQAKEDYQKAAERAA